MTSSLPPPPFTHTHPRPASHTALAPTGREGGGRQAGDGTGTRGEGAFLCGGGCNRTGGGSEGSSARRCADEQGRWSAEPEHAQGLPLQGGWGKLLVLEAAVGCPPCLSRELSREGGGRFHLCVWGGEKSPLALCLWRAATAGGLCSALLY